MSLDSVALIVEIENHFGISISDGEAEKISTVQDFIDCVYQKLSIEPEKQLSKDEVSIATIEIISISTGTPLSEIKPHYSIAGDLGID
jgi:Phosphopantetheine attachment site